MKISGIFIVRSEAYDIFDKQLSKAKDKHIKDKIEKLFYDAADLVGEHKELTEEKAEQVAKYINQIIPDGETDKKIEEKDILAMERSMVRINYDKFDQKVDDKYEINYKLNINSFISNHPLLAEEIKYFQTTYNCQVKIVVLSLKAVDPYMNDLRSYFCDNQREDSPFVLLDEKNGRFITWQYASNVRNMQVKIYLLNESKKSADHATKFLQELRKDLIVNNEYKQN